jgi:hypothetical protein
VRSLTGDERAGFGHVPDRDLARARLVVVPWLSPGTSAMTLGRFVLIRRGHEDDRPLLGHELVHVRQWRELGVARFLAQYLTAYARGRARGLGHWDAYLAIPLEREARELSGR